MVYYGSMKTTLARKFFDCGFTPNEMAGLDEFRGMSLVTLKNWYIKTLVFRYKNTDNLQILNLMDIIILRHEMETHS